MKQHRFTLIAGFLFVLIGQTVWADLAGYVKQADDSFSFEVVERRPVDGGEVIIASLVSQTWQGIPWRHWLAVFCPETMTYTDNMVLVVGGGNVQDAPPDLGRGESQAAAMVARQIQSAVAVVSAVPNQPLFGGMREDEIIAYTYDKFIKGEGDDWPLLLPMAKSAVKAMDALQQIMRSERNQEVKGFMLTGGSKRGWTSWLTAASGDSRVVAIAPAVIDMLNIVPQMKHQKACYGVYSEQIDDYTELGLQERMIGQEGDALRAIVDPYSYRDKLLMPKMVVLGTNDPYWTVDAASFYFPGLKGEKHLIYQPNTGHDVNLDGISAMAHFFLAVQRGAAYPAISWTVPEPGRLQVTWEESGGTAYLWQASSATRDFREAAWTSQALSGIKIAEAAVAAPDSGWTAFYVEVRWPGEGGFPYGNCTEMTVLPETLPFDDDQEVGARAAN